MLVCYGTPLTTVTSGTAGGRALPVLTWWNNRGIMEDEDLIMNVWTVRLTSNDTKTMELLVFFNK